MRFLYITPKLPHNSEYMCGFLRENLKIKLGAALTLQS